MVAPLIGSTPLTAAGATKKVLNFKLKTYPNHFVQNYVPYAPIPAAGCQDHSKSYLGRLFYSRTFFRGDRQLPLNPTDDSTADSIGESGKLGFLAYLGKRYHSY